MSNLFFKPTPLYKEYKILDLIEKDPYVTQRTLSDSIGASVSMINAYLDKYEKNGYLNRVHLTNKNVEYHISKKGIERKKLLNIEYLKSSYLIYSSARENILLFLNQIIEKGFKKILLYGAGEVAEIMLLVSSEYKDSKIKVLAIVDDDINKIGKKIFSIPIIGTDKIHQINHDGILISSYTHKETIYRSLVSMNYDEEKIIRFFER